MLMGASPHPPLLIKQVEPHEGGDKVISRHEHSKPPSVLVQILAGVSPQSPLLTKHSLLSTQVLSTLV
jgi:hypothetical protein